MAFIASPNSFDFVVTFGTSTLLLLLMLLLSSYFVLISGSGRDGRNQIPNPPMRTRTRICCKTFTMLNRILRRPSPAASPVARCVVCRLLRHLSPVALLARRSPRRRSVVVHRCAVVAAPLSVVTVRRLPQRRSCCPATPRLAILLSSRRNGTLQLYSATGDWRQDVMALGLYSSAMSCFCCRVACLLVALLLLLLPLLFCRGVLLSCCCWCGVDVGVVVLPLLRRRSNCCYPAS